MANFVVSKKAHRTMILDQDKPGFDEMQNVKRRFFALRNGVIADVLRKAGSPYRIIFGLNLPQLTDVAHTVGINNDLGRRLWANSTTRESRLLAPMVFDASTFAIDDARQLIRELISVEEADILCLKLLKRLDYHDRLIDEFHDSDRDMERYCALRLTANFLNSNPAFALDIATAELERANHLTLPLARQIKSDAEFFLSAE
jgi:3-methyladenine DNA glycosylase AlkD